MAFIVENHVLEMSYPCGLSKPVVRNGCQSKPRSRRHVFTNNYVFAIQEPHNGSGGPTTYLQAESGSYDTTARFWFKLASEASMQSTALFVTTFDHLLDAFPAKRIHGLNERLRKQSLPAPYLRRIKVLMPRCEPTTLVQKVASQCREACVKRLRFLFGYGIPFKRFCSTNVDDPAAVFSLRIGAKDK